MTLNTETSTIKFSDTSATSKTFTGGGLTYNNFEISATTGTASYIVAGSNTFNDFKSSKTVASTITLTAGTTQTVTTFTVSGTSGNIITLNSSSAGSAATLSDSSGVNILSYCSIQDVTGAGGATWQARDSSNVSGNSNIYFIQPILQVQNLRRAA
jgi:hypothetical protein